MKSDRPSTPNRGKIRRRPRRPRRGGRSRGNSLRDSLKRHQATYRTLGWVNLLTFLIPLALYLLMFVKFRAMLSYYDLMGWFLVSTAITLFIPAIYASLTPFLFARKPWSIWTSLPLYALGLLGSLFTLSSQAHELRDAMGFLFGSLRSGVTVVYMVIYGLCIWGGIRILGQRKAFLARGFDPSDPLDRFAGVAEEVFS